MMSFWSGMGSKLGATLRRGEPILKGKVSPMLSIPANISKPEYAAHGKPHNSAHVLAIYTNDQLPGIRKAAKLARQMLAFAESLAVPGITTDEIDRRTHEEIVKNGAYPTPLNYYTFPKSICTSVNEVVCHGIPDDRALQEGDILSIDVSLFVGGYHGDNCGTIVVGKGAPELDKLIEVTKQSVASAIDVCRPGECITSIGNAIQTVADEHGYSIVPNFCGHGTGKFIHMAPLILHYRNNEALRLRPGMVFTIEPIMTEGAADIQSWSDGWTAATKDGSWSAQIEHEILITESGAEILTTLDSDQ